MFPGGKIRTGLCWPGVVNGSTCTGDVPDFKLIQYWHGVEMITPIYAWPYLFSNVGTVMESSYPPTFSNNSYQIHIKNITIVRERISYTLHLFNYYNTTTNFHIYENYTGM